MMAGQQPGQHGVAALARLQVSAGTQLPGELGR